MRRTYGYRRGTVAYFIPMAFQSLTAKISFRLHAFLFVFCHIGVGWRKTKLKMKKLSTILAVAIFATSCAMQQTPPPNVEHAYYESSVRILEPEQSMLLSPVMADLEVSNYKVIHTEKEAFAEIRITDAVIANMAEFKKIALSRAAKAHNADVLVGTIIDVATVNKRLEITVSGYPAYYRNFRTATKADAELVQSALSVKNRDLESDIVSSPTKRYDRKETK